MEDTRGVGTKQGVSEEVRKWDQPTAAADLMVWKQKATYALFQPRAVETGYKGCWAQ